MRRLALRVLGTLTALQLLTGAELFVRGFPYFGSSLVNNAAFWEAPIALFHAPAIAMLYLTGQCCGFRNGAVLGPRIAGGHIRLTPSGLAVLSLTNFAVWLMLGAIGTVLRLRHRSPGRSDTPPAPLDGGG
jgi:hypothetical protein